ncbi:MAG: hypothetical protein OK455_11250 [Thaumarchaeota archaeon]|nr:hypothetical protein [Nitrososphaerota archaeon]
MSSSLPSRIATIVIVAALYAVGKALTAFIPTPWGIGQFLIGLFIPAFFAVVSETVPVAIGAGLGTFVGDVVFLTPLGETTPILSLVAGVPANFLAFLLFGWFVKRYASWPAFVACTVCFVTLGNLIAAVSVVEFLKLPQGLILGFTVFWNTGAIPAVIVGVPILVRATSPLLGRSSILKYPASWSASVGGRQTVMALAFSALFVLLGAALFLTAPGTLSNWPGLAFYFGLAAAVVVIFGPIAGLLAGTKRSSYR